MPGILIKRVDPAIEPEGWTYMPCGRVWLKIDRDDYAKYKGYHYKLKRSGSCFYPVRVVNRNGKRYYIRLHREIAHTPQGYDCHHINHNTLDVRRENLENLTPDEHAQKRNS